MAAEPEFIGQPGGSFAASTSETDSALSARTQFLEATLVLRLSGLQPQVAVPQPLVGGRL